MRRAWLLSMLLAGCDQVYGLHDREVLTGDEDGDRFLDQEDKCPHIKNESSVDADHDNISVDCDPDDNDGSTLFRWFPITGGSVEGLSQEDGDGKILDDAYELGNHDDLSSLVFDVDTGTAVVEVGFEIVSSSVEDEMQQPWAELGVITVHRSFVPDREVRGDVCFVGVSLNEMVMPPEVGDAYLELDEDELPKPSVMFASPLNGTVGALRQLRTPQEVTCTLLRAEKTPTTRSFDVDKLAATTGKIAITSQRMVTKLTYVWIAWQP